MPKSLAQLTDMYYEEPVPQPLPVDIPRVVISSNVGTDNIVRPEPDYVNPPQGNAVAKLTGGEGERYQLWPEKIIREGLSAAGKVMSGEVPQWSIDKDTGDVHTSPQMIEKAQEISALAGSGGIGGTGPNVANRAGADVRIFGKRIGKGSDEVMSEVPAIAFGATPSLRPALRYKDKLYKGKEGQQHLDVIPENLYGDFQKKAMSGADINEYNFGFVNDKGQFLTREKALEYGINTGLIDPAAGKYGALTSTLMADSSKPGTAIEAVAKTAPTFYSAVEHNVNAIPQAKMTGEQWLGTLSNKPGVKGEELDWTGLKSFLEENKGKPVTKEQIQEHLAANKVELKEVSKGGFTKVDKERFNQLNDKNELTSLEQKELETLDFKRHDRTKYSDYQLPGGPLSRDTEILTNKGWKRIDAVEIGDVIMTRKDDAGILEWQPVQATPKVYAENLYHFFSQSINMRVTENHQMIAKKRRRSGNNELQRLTAKELWCKSEMLVPLTGVWNGGETDKIFGFDPHDLAELFGWYLAEGSYKREGDVKNTIQIAQCREYNSEKCNRIEALLNRMGIAWKYYGEAYGIGVKTLNKDLVALFHEQPTSEFKFVPHFFFEQSKSVIQSLLDGLILGDGCTSEQEGRLDKTTFFTKSEQLAGDVQILILMIGKNANVRQRPSGLYCVGIKSKEWSSVDEAKFEIAPYNDFAFCVTVENHAIYVRRNGVAAFTGNSNYREVLMTLPPTKNTLNQFKVINEHGQVESTWTDKAKAEAWAKKNNYTIREDKPVTLDSGYKSSHWNEPNILAHVRMNDRTIDGKKSLHVEEIQSDWHQQGRDKGYKDPEAQKKYDAAYKAVEDARAKFREREKNGDFADLPEINKVLDPLIAARSKASEALTNTIPDAPFKKTWHELALKRMLREAAEKGYDRLSWTPGEAQAARYDLSKQIGSLKATPIMDQHGLKYEIRATNKAGTSEVVNSVHTADELPNVVGKEMAKKIVEESEGKKPVNYKGLDLKIGGEGMKGFYDQIIPKALEKLGKEHGVKVKKGEVKGDHDASMNEPFESRDKAIDVLNRGGEIYAVSRNDETLVRTVKELKEAENELGKPFSQFILGDKQPGQPVFYIDIPQSLKDQALQKGFPLFSAGGYMLMPVVGNPFAPESQK